MNLEIDVTKDIVYLKIHYTCYDATYKETRGSIDSNIWYKVRGIIWNGIYDVVYDATMESLDEVIEYEMHMY